MFTLLLLIVFLIPFFSSLAFITEHLSLALALLIVSSYLLIRQYTALGLRRPVLLALGFYLAGLVIATAFSNYHLISFVASYKFLLGILIFLISASLSPKRQFLLAGTILAAGIVAAVLSLYQYFHSFNVIRAFLLKENITDTFTIDYVLSQRTFFPFVTPNTLGGFLAMVLPLALIWKRSRWLIAVMFLALILTRSMGALLSAGIGMLIFFSVGGLIKSRKKLLLSCLGLGAILTVMAVLRFNVAGEHLKPLFSASMRLKYWTQTLSIISASPLFGLGCGVFNLPETRYAHNSYLQLWAEAGIITLASFLWLIFLIIRTAWREFREGRFSRYKAAILAGCLAFLVHNLLDFSLFLPETALIWWALAGLLFTSKPRSD